MIHTTEEVLEKVQVLCRKIFELQDEYREPDPFYVYQIDDIAYIARLIMAEINGVKNPNS